MKAMRSVPIVFGLMMSGIALGLILWLGPTWWVILISGMFGLSGIKNILIGLFASQRELDRRTFGGPRWTDAEIDRTIDDILRPDDYGVQDAERMRRIERSQSDKDKPSSP